MYFHSSFKLVGAVLLSALVVNAAPSELRRTMTLSALTDYAGNTVWSNPNEQVLIQTTDRDDLAFNPDPEVYIMYEVMYDGWMTQSGGYSTLVKPAFGLTTQDGSEMSEEDETKLKEENVILDSGYDETGRYWVVRRRSR